MYNVLLDSRVRFPLIKDERCETNLPGWRLGEELTLLLYRQTPLIVKLTRNSSVYFTV